MSWFEKLLNKPMRRRAIGVGETEADKASLAGDLYNYLIQDGNLSPELCSNMATEEMWHAFADDGPAELGALLNLLGRAVGGYCYHLEEMTDEEVYLSDMAGVPHGLLVSDWDLRLAIEVAGGMTVEEIHKLNLQICGDNEILARALDIFILRHRTENI